MAESRETREIESLRATVERIVFQSDDTGYVVARVTGEDNDEAVTVAGTLPSVRAGQKGVFTGRWVQHPKFGRQFQGDSFSEIAPATCEGIEKYLGSGMVKGIGREFAKRLVDKFGADTLRIITEEPHRLREVDGIGKKRLDLITRTWDAKTGQMDAMVFLQGHGIGPQRAVKIFRTYGGATIGLIRANPYRLASDIWGIGFKLADRIARTLGFAADSIERAKAAVIHLLHEASNQGHCFLTVPQLQESAEKLTVPEAVLTRALDTLSDSGPVIIEGGQRVYLKFLHKMEVQCAGMIGDLCRTKPKPFKNPKELLTEAQRKSGILLAPVQRDAVLKAMESQISIITGGPGVGKTSILKVLAQVIGESGETAAFCAPTGRAAKRMSQSIGKKAATIHRLFGFKAQKAGPLEAAPETRITGGWLIVDETSMMDLPLFHGVLSATGPAVRLVLVGDSDQLPSVGPGQVLADLIGCGKIPVTHLTQVFRQKAGSLIVSNAHRINHGFMPVFPPQSREVKSDFYFINCDDPDKISDIIVQLVTERIPSGFGYDRDEDIQVLSPMRHRKLGTSELNDALRAALNPLSAGSRAIAINDRVMQIRNNYDKQVFNGDMGRVVAKAEGEFSVTVDFDGHRARYDMSDIDELVSAYAVTVHKSQGSEFQAVVMPLYTGHYVLLQRNLIYTAITRAKGLMVLVGSKKALRMAVSNNKINIRNTALKERIGKA